jgi:allantoinase
MRSWVIRGDRVVLPDGMRPAVIRVDNGVITAIDKQAAFAQGATVDNEDRVAFTSSDHVIDAGAAVVMPGIVDTHVHINEPGRTEWEGFETATRAAAAGGVTTLVDMPLNSIPATTNVDALESKRRAAEGRCYVDVGFWGGVVPGNARQLEPLAHAGVLGFKCFLSPSGVDEFAAVSEYDLRSAMPILARSGLPLLTHAEWPGLLYQADPRKDPRHYKTWLNLRPPGAEHAAIELMLQLSGRTGARVHIVHLASAGGLPVITKAKNAGVPVTVETCPHYLTFCAEEIPAGATALKCAPPIRERDHREKLWQALRDSEIDLVATDHSPAPPALKHLDDGDFIAAWGGIASLQVALPVMWTGARQRGIPFEQLAEWMCAAPAKLAGLTGRKGAIATGHDADVVIVDPDREFTVDASRLYHRHAITPYDGARLHGVVLKTMLRGEIVYDNGTIAGSPAGRLISR